MTTREDLAQKLIWASEKYEQLITKLVEAMPDAEDEHPELKQLLDDLTTHVAEVRSIIALHTHHLRADDVDLEHPV